ncbi:Uncharacterised protein [uncultured archaeon]|nr:Uncharacterised protein [uncultured archaeon]
MNELLNGRILYLINGPAAEVAHGVAVAPLDQCLASSRSEDPSPLQRVDVDLCDIPLQTGEFLKVVKHPIGIGQQQV